MCTNARLVSTNAITLQLRMLGGSVSAVVLAQVSVSPHDRIESAKLSMSLDRLDVYLTFRCTISQKSLSRWDASLTESPTNGHPHRTDPTAQLLHEATQLGHIYMYCFLGTLHLTPLVVLG